VRKLERIFHLFAPIPDVRWIKWSAVSPTSSDTASMSFVVTGKTDRDQVLERNKKITAATNRTFVVRVHGGGDAASTLTDLAYRTDA
jgi:hypothetical protein